MNKTINLLSVFCLVAIIATSCEKEPILEVFQSSFNFSDQGSSQTISFSTNRDWSASVSGGTWCTISPARGSSDVKSIKVSVTANDTYDGRSVTITIKAEELTKVITINQPKNKAILLTKDRYEVGPAGGIISVELRTNIEYDVTIPAENETWIANTTTKGLVTNNLIFAIAANATYDNRQGKVIIKEKTSSLSDTVYVSQSQKDAIILTTKTYNVADTAITISVELKSNVSYLVTIPTAAQLWITQVQTKALITEQLQFNIAKNTAFEPRSAEIIIRQSLLTLADTLYINQAKVPNAPTVTTYDASNVTENSVSTGGNVTADGGATVKARGVCWSTNENPTIADSKITNGSGTGSFFNVITGLASGTTYYVRAYSTNRIGTSYGNQISFETLGAIVNIPDANFKAYCLQNFDNNHDGEISTTESTAVAFINCGNKNISSLEGIQAFTNLQTLWCEDNQLTSIDISKNTTLQYIKCPKNQLTSLDVSKNTLLYDINCSFNQLKTLDIKYNTALRFLSCNNNQLTSLDVSKHTALMDFMCYENQLTYLDVSNNSELKRLWCQANQLTSLDVSKNALLTDFRCSANKLTSIDISHNIQLMHFDGSYNPLTNIDLSHNTLLEQFSLVGNHLTSLDLTHNIALKDFVCNYNQLTSLDLSQNSLLEGFSCYVNNLTSLDVSHNSALSSFYCDANQLTSLDVSNNAALTQLQCRENLLTSLDVSSNKMLENLWCSKNPYLTKLFFYPGQTISDLIRDDFTIIYYKQPSTNSIQTTNKQFGVAARNRNRHHGKIIKRQLIKPMEIIH